VGLNCVFLLGNSGTTAFWITYALRPDAIF